MSNVRNMEIKVQMATTAIKTFRSLSHHRPTLQWESHIHSIALRMQYVPDNWILDFTSPVPVIGLAFSVLQINIPILLDINRYKGGTFPGDCGQSAHPPVFNNYSGS